MATESTSNKIELEIVTPRGRELAVSVDEVTAPSVNGEFGVMPGHLPLVAALRTGIVTYRQGGESKKCAVGQGFAEAGSNKLLILTDQYTERSKIDPVVVRKELADLQALIAKTENKADAVAPLARPQVLVQADNEIRLSLGAETLAVEELKMLIVRENWLAAQLELYGDAPIATMRPFENWAVPEQESAYESDDAGTSGVTSDKHEKSAGKA